MEGNGGNKMLEIIFGRVAEAIYFSLFIIFTKRLKEKRILFTILMIAEYLILYACFPYDIKFQISYTFISYIILKILYKEKAQTTDIFTFAIGSIVLMISCLLPSFIFLSHFSDLFYYYIYVAITRILIFGFLFIFKDKLYKIQNIYKKIWNRNDKVNKKIKSTTFRSLNIAIFNIMFYILNICMLYAIFLRK